MTLRSLHRTSATLLVTFACIHIVNHLVSLRSVVAHIAFMESARLIYRYPAVEILLLFCIAFQVVSGLWMVVRGWKQRCGFVAWTQAFSGAYLAFFFVVHVTAVLYGRSVLNFDTNFYFAAAGFHVPPYQYFFGPYYFLAVLALFTHLSCVAYWQLQNRSAHVRILALGAPMILGAIVSLLIVMSLAGNLERVEVPEKYKAIYQGKPGNHRLARTTSTAPQQSASTRSAD
jgi:hypothetical protein